MMRRLSAFSLIEVLVAFVLLSSVMVVVIPALANSQSDMSQRTQQAFALDYARSRLAQYGPLVPLVSQTNRGDAFEWVWVDEVSVERLPGSTQERYRVDITIFDRAGRAQLARVTGYR